MKNIFILFLSFFSLIFYSQSNIVPIAPPPVQIQTINASNFKVELDKINNYIHWSFNFSGDYFKVQTTVYKNSISSSNRIAYGVKEDEAWYQPIHYPAGSVYTDWNYNPNSSAFNTVTKYILLIEAWEVIDSPKQTLTLEYTPPVETPNLSILSVQIYSSLSGVKIYDSSTSGNNSPQLQKNASYKFVARMRKTGNAYVQNIRFDLCQYDMQQGSYPSVSPKAIKTEYFNLSQTQNDASIDFETTIADFGANSFMGIAFHLDKDNTIVETNENDNIALLGAGYHSRIANNSRDKIQVDVYDMNGNLLKKLETTSDDSNFMKVKSELNSGKYILKSKEQSRQVLIK